MREAQEIQVRLAAQVSCANTIPERPRFVAGTDISPPDRNGVVCGAAVVMSLLDMEVVEVKCAWGRPAFPYVPGFLSFREAPLVLEALKRLVIMPDFLLADGQGLAHPRRFGLACHLGVLTGLPTIGCAKSILQGTHGPLGQEKGAWVPLENEGTVVGAALRTRDGVRPMYVSIGYKVDLPSAIRWVMACCTRFRMPEPTRQAHQAAAGRLSEQEPVESGTRA